MEKTKSPQRVFIGGISGGVGHALAKRLVAGGCTVAGFSRNGEGADLEGVQVFRADARDSAAVETVFAEAEEAMGGIEAYVHAIGSVALKPAHLLTDGEWGEVLATNLNSAFFCARSAVNRMRRAKRGRILFCSSVASRIGLANHEAIAAAKGGINGLTLALAASYAPMGIRVNAIALGLVETGATAGLLGSEQARKISASMHPTGMIGQPEAVAGYLAWLLSEEADWMTGQVLSFDGGMSAVLPKPRV